MHVNAILASFFPNRMVGTDQFLCSYEGNTDVQMSKVHS